MTLSHQRYWVYHFQNYCDQYLFRNTTVSINITVNVLITLKMQLDGCWLFGTQFSAKLFSLYLLHNCFFCSGN